MYEKLISSLRICQGMCEGSRFEEAAKLLTQAADAIEELSGLVNHYGGETGIKNLEEYAKKYWDTLTKIPRWIPVTEKLPEEYEDVLCYYEYFRYGNYNCMFRTIDRGYYGDGRWGGEAGQGHKNKVLAWMPLPSTEGLNEA